MSTAQKVTVVASVLIIVQLAFRAWAAFGGWFFIDDFKFLSASRQPLTLGLLMEPHDDKLMPGGLLIAWLVAKSGAFAWPVAAASLVAMQAMASVACWFMLRSLFEVRWVLLAPLAIYLFAPMTLTGFMWWGAAINLVPMQIAMFLAVGCHVRYLSTDKLRYAILAALSVALAMAFYQKSLLIYPVIALLSVSYFGQGGWFRSFTYTLARWWRGWLIHAAFLTAYLTYIVIKVPSPVSTDGAVDYPGIVGSLTFKTFLTTAIGGPWRWAEDVMPAVQVDPPTVTIVLAALVAASVIVYGALRRTHTVMAWVILTLYVVADGLLLATGRGSTAGVLAAVEARYVSDAAPVLVLALALAFIPLASSRARGSALRESPILNVRVPRAATVALGLVIAAGSVVSSLQYVRYWHDDFAARRFVDNVTAAERQTGNIDVLDVEVPSDVLLGGLFPYTLPSKFFNGSPHIRAHDSGTNLQILDGIGIARIAYIYDGVTTPSPAGGECGALYSTERSPDAAEGPASLALKLSGPASDFTTWLAFSYLASKDGSVKLTTGATSTTVPLLRGPNTYFMRASGEFRSVVLTNLSDDMTLCASSIKVGRVRASAFS